MNEHDSLEAPPPRPSLVRPREGRVLAGVAAGLADHLNISVALVRIAVVISVFFGGAGIIGYLAGWLLIRNEDEPEAIANRLARNLGSGYAWLGVILLAIGFAVIADNVFFLRGGWTWALILIVVGYLLYRGDIPRPSASPPTGPPSPADPGREVAAPAVPPRPPSILGRLTVGTALLAIGALAVADNLLPGLDARPRHYLALATLVLGLGLLVGAFLGHARWLTLVGVFLLVPGLFGSPLAEYDWQRGLGRYLQPAIPAELSSSYDLGLGRYVFDLTRLEWREGTVIPLRVDLGAGEIVVRVPPDVAIQGRAEVGAGRISAPGMHRSGAGDLLLDLDVPGTTGIVTVDLEVGAGSVEIYYVEPAFAEDECEWDPDACEHETGEWWTSTTIYEGAD